MICQTNIKGTSPKFMKSSLTLEVTNQKEFISSFTYFKNQLSNKDDFNSAKNYKK